MHGLVLANDPQDQLPVQGVDANSIDETDVVFGIGTMAQLRMTRYRDLRRIDLLRDLVLSHAGLDPSAVLTETLPPILRHARHAPAFKYLNLERRQRLRLAYSLRFSGAESRHENVLRPSSKSSYRGFPLKKCRDPRLIARILWRRHLLS